MGYVKVERTCEENEDHTGDYCAACSTCHECAGGWRELTGKTIDRLALELKAVKARQDYLLARVGVDRGGVYFSNANSKINADESLEWIDINLSVDNQHE